MDLTKFSLEELTALATEKREALFALFSVESPSDEQVAEADALALEVDGADAELASRAAVASERAEKFADLKARFTVEDEEAAEEVVEEAAEEVVEEAAEEEEVVVERAAAKVVAKGTVKALAKRTPRPKAPQSAAPGAITITAAADVPEFATGSGMAGLAEVATAVINRAKGFPSFRVGNGGEPELHKFGVASFKLDFPDDLTVKRGSDDFAIIEHARSESRLEGNSLVAAGGWCAPSETIYDLCEGETLEGIISVPEINVARGGINTTSGPDFASLYTDTGFLQTEAQAIAGTAKNFYEITCPPFAETRLDAIGLGITVPILTNATYPELVKRVVSGSLVAHQHRINASVITRMQTLSGVARVITGLGATTDDTMEGLELLADERRQHYRLGITSTLEVIVPFWVRGAIRSDMARRAAVAVEAITDANIDAHFTARHLNVQWAYDWQPLLEDAEVYPLTFNALMYPAGTFIKGVNDVINLSAVYDSASLKVNTYTGLFMEQGLLVVKTCFGSDLVTLPVRNDGTRGALNINVA